MFGRCVCALRPLETRGTCARTLALRPPRGPPCRAQVPHSGRLCLRPHLTGSARKPVSSAGCARCRGQRRGADDSERGAPSAPGPRWWRCVILPRTLCRPHLLPPQGARRGPAGGLPAKALGDLGLNGGHLAHPLHFHSVCRNKYHQIRLIQKSAGRMGRKRPPSGSGPSWIMRKCAFNPTERDGIRWTWAAGSRNMCDGKRGGRYTHHVSQALESDSVQQGHVPRKGPPRVSPTAALLRRPTHRSGGTWL